MVRQPDAAPKRRTIQARWLLPIRGNPIPNGQIHFESGRIVEIGKATGTDDVFELADAVVLPAPANAHTHLELSRQASLQPQPDSSFPAWLDRVISFRKQERQTADSSSIEARMAAVREGLDESMRSGTGPIGEIVSLPPSVLERTYTTGGGRLFFECLGLLTDRVRTAKEQLADFVQYSSAWSRAWRPGVSPHAPYSVAPALLKYICRLAQDHNWPVAMHLAESAEELELLDTGQGPLVDVLDHHGAWKAGVVECHAQPLDYLAQLNQAPRSLVIHGNYLDRQAWEFLAARRDRMAVVYCPRTHAAFAHQPYPLREMLELGVRVLLGTDSLATNPSLSILEELAFCRANYPWLAPSRLLEMVTADYWEWSAFPEPTGMAEGSRTSLIAVELPDPGDPYSFFDSNSPKVIWRQ